MTHEHWYYELLIVFVGYIRDLAESIADEASSGHATYKLAITKTAM